MGAAVDTKEDESFQRLIAAVREAGDLLLSMWPGRVGNKNSLLIQEKRDGSLVSSADFASNNILVSAIRSLYPDDRILSEEVETDASQIRAGPRVWIIDPLDGTSPFLEGRDDFSVLVGLSSEHKARAGIVYLPARGQMLVARTGRGAILNGAPVRVSTEAQPRPQRVYVRRFSSTAPHLESVQMDSGLALTSVATGELDGAIIKMTTHREWDIAAPIALIQEAGGAVSDEHGRPIPLGMGGIGFQYFVASNARVHQQLLQIIPH